MGRHGGGPRRDGEVIDSAARAAKDARALRFRVEADREWRIVADQRAGGGGG